jgi:hypothetical protein
MMRTNKGISRITLMISTNDDDNESRTKSNILQIMDDNYKISNNDKVNKCSFKNRLRPRKRTV